MLKVVVSFLCSCTLVLAGAKLSLAVPASASTTCSGVVKVSYGTFSHLKATLVTCGYARAFVKISGGVPSGWACTSKRAGVVTTNICRNGRKVIGYEFVT